MLKLSICGMLVLGCLHLIILGADALTALPGWMSGELWTWDHWQPVMTQQPLLVLSGFAFWSTIGSFAVPLIILSLLLLWMIRQRIVIPRFVGLGLVAWGGVCTALMLPSGFPVLGLVAVVMSWSLTRKSHEIAKV